MAGAVSAGYSAAVTDAGHTPLNPLDGSFALDGEGRLNWSLIQAFAYRAVHDLAVVGKVVTAAYCGSQARFSYNRVQQSLGHRANPTRFARVFLAPGMAHCAGGPGPQPDDPLSQLVEWVENGKAPRSLNGVVRDPSTGAVTATRPICMYPKLAVYKGRGPTNQASSFACRRH